MTTKELKIKNSLLSRHWFNLCLILFVSIVVMIPMLTANTVFGHDIRYHLEVIRSLDVAFKDGRFFTQIIDMICQDYGYGTGLFYSLIPHGIAVIIMNILHCNNITAIAIELILLFSLSGVVFYGFSRSFFKDNRLAIISSILYLTTPYLLNEIYVRFAFSEAFFTLTIPMIAWGLYELINNKNIKLFFPLFTLGYALAFLTHFTLTVYFTLFAAVYICFYLKKFFKEHLYIPFIISVVIVVMISASFYIPMLVNYPNVQVGSMNYGANFLSFNGLWAFFNYWLITTTIINIATLVIFTKKIKQNKAQNTKRDIILYTLLWMSFGLSTALFPYFILPDIFGIIQYAWRFYMVNATILALVITHLFKDVKIHKHKVALLTFTALAFVITISSAMNTCYFLDTHRNAVDRYSYTIINGKSENWGIGANKNGDYFPKGANQEYIFKRANDVMIIETNSTISELANYQEINQLSFILQRKADPYVILNIPYSVCEDIAVYQITDNTENASFDVEKTLAHINGHDYLKLNMVNAGDISKVTISYAEESLFDTYLKAHPFEFVVKSGDANFTNFHKLSSSRYSVDISTSQTTTIELPTLYYKGYTIKYITDNSTECITYQLGVNGFIEVELDESGKLLVEFEGDYITKSNYISIAGIVLFLVSEVVWIALYFKNKHQTVQFESKDNV